MTAIITVSCLNHSHKMLGQVWKNRLLYYFVVLTVIKAVWSSEVLLPEEPGEPQQLEVLEVTSNSVKLSWQPPVRQSWQNYSIAGYRVHYKLESDLVHVSQLFGNLLECVINGLEPAERYSFAVAAFTPRRFLGRRTTPIQAVTDAVEEDTEFDMTTVNVTAVEGGTVRLPCHIPATARMHTLTWRISGSNTVLTVGSMRVIDDPRFSIASSEPGDYDLSIQSIRTSDPGTYLCAVSTAFPSVKRVNLRVHSPAQLVTVPRNNMVGEGNDVIMTCVASGIPSPTVTWYYKSPEHEEFEEVAMPEGSGPTSNLLLRDVQRWQMGNYKCRADNGVGDTAAHTARLDVDFAPDIHLPTPRLDQRRGGDTHLECEISAPPGITVMNWYFNGTRVTDGPWHKVELTSLNHTSNLLTLHISELSASDFGTYTCATHNFNRFRLEVRRRAFLELAELCAGSNCTVDLNGSGSSSSTSSSSPETTTRISTTAVTVHDTDDVSEREKLTVEQQQADALTGILDVLRDIRDVLRAA